MLENVDDFSFFGYSSSFCFLLIEFHCTFSISYKILYILYLLLLYLDYVVISSSVYSTVFPTGSVTGCDSSLGGGWTIYHFRSFKFF